MRNYDCHINELKDRNTMIVSIDAIKVFDKNHNFFIKKIPRHQDEGNISQRNKNYTEQIYSQ